MQPFLPLNGTASSPHGDQGADAVSPPHRLRQAAVPEASHHDADGPPLGSAAATSSKPRPTRKRDRGEMSRADVAYPRKRATAACRLCRSRKVKCNNARPTCGNCSSHNATCVYEDSDDVSAYDPASIAILDRLNQVLSRLDYLPVPPERGSSDQEAIRSVVSTATSPNLPNLLRPQSNAGETSTEAQTISRDELTIPAAQTTSEAVLRWPILENRYPPNYIIDTVFEGEIVDADSDEEDAFENQRFSALPRTRAIVFNEDDVLPLMQRFLDLVHIKNPVFETETIWSYARRVAEDGLKWDSASCMVLIACALGSVAQPFPESKSAAEPCSASSLKLQTHNLQRGEVYFNLARRRLGLLQKGLLAPQCHFFAGVYLMYTMRPLLAWTQFHSAGRFYHVYLQCQARRSSKSASCAKSAKRRQLEQRLYWSCYKSECELRAEMDLPNSSLASFHYPDMHPSPPDMDSPRDEAMGQTSQGDGPEHSSVSRPPTSLNQHQEESWYYYLTEITLRRISNDILNEFYVHGHEGWNNGTICFMVHAARGFEQQLAEWYDGLPPLIRFEDVELPSRELPYMVKARVFEIKTWLYRPFLYYAIHSPADAPHQALVQPLVDKAVLWHLRSLSGEPSIHRHHGSWFANRVGATNSLVLLAAAKSGRVTMPSGLDWRGEIRHCIGRMRFWEDEGPGISRAIEILESYM